MPSETIRHPWQDPVLYCLLIAKVWKVHLTTKGSMRTRWEAWYDSLGAMPITQPDSFPTICHPCSSLGTPAAAVAKHHVNVESRDHPGAFLQETFGGRVCRQQMLHSK